MTYEETPEYHRLMKVLKKLQLFQEQHEETIQCNGCKLCLDYRDFDRVFMFKEQPIYPKKNDNCTYTKVVKEHLNEDALLECNALYEELGEANESYLIMLGYKAKK